MNQHTPLISSMGVWPTHGKPLFELCIWREGGNVEKPRCNQPVLGRHKSACTCRNHGAAYRWASDRVKAALREAANVNEARQENQER